MDKMRPFILISVLGGLIYLGFIYYSDQSVIDDEYVASESYLQLEEEIKREQKNTISNLKQFRIVLEEIIRSDSSKQLELPVEDTDFLNEKESEWENRGDFRFFKMGSLDKGLMKVYFVLMQQPGMYSEAGLIMATAQEDSLIEFETIGQFKDSVAEEVETQIYLKDIHLIGTKVITKRLYPVEQENVSTFFYRITETGEIKRIEG